MMSCAGEDLGKQVSEVPLVGESTSKFQFGEYFGVIYLNLKCA